MKAKTFFSDEPDEVEVIILGKIGNTDTYKVRYGTREIARHRDRLKPLDEEARRLLGK